MPTPIAQLSKATIRKELARRTGTWQTYTTSGAGNAGGTTAVCATLIGYGDDYFKDLWLLLMSGTYAGQWRRITAFTSSSGTITVANAFGGQVANTVTFEIHAFRPDWFTIAYNDACEQAYPAVYKPVTGLLVGDGDAVGYGTVRNMRDILSVSIQHQATEKVDDTFTGADSATNPGTGWTVVAGTHGISSNRWYSVTDADADLMVQTTDPELYNGYFRCVVNGTLNSGAIYRCPALVFRYSAAATHLRVRLRNGLVELVKRDAGTDTVLDSEAVTTSDGVDYLLSVLAQGTRIRVWVDDVELIQYELLGTDLQYLAYGNCGLRLDKAGAPATAARADDFRAHSLTEWSIRPDWEQDAARLLLNFGDNRDRQLAQYEDRLLLVEGRALLTQLAEDTTFGTLAADSTAAAEVTTSEPGWTCLVQYCLSNLYGLAAQGTLEDQQRLWDLGSSALERAEQLRRRAMPQPKRLLRFTGTE